MSHPFEFMGPSHLTAIALTLATPALLSAIAHRRKDARTDKFIRWTFAAIAAANWLLWMCLLYARGWLSIGNAIPLNLCDWATVAVLVALIQPTQKSFELAYFWSMCGTLQALVTPDCVYDFPDTQFILFFVYHGGIIAAVLYMTFGKGLRPVPASLPRVLGWTVGYAAVAGAVDAALGTNYGFLRSKPDHPSFLDLLSPWPWYLPELVVAAIVFMAIFYAPFFVLDRVRPETRDTM